MNGELNFYESRERYFKDSKIVKVKIDENDKISGGPLSYTSFWKLYFINKDAYRYKRVYLANIFNAFVTVEFIANPIRNGRVEYDSDLHKLEKHFDSSYLILPIVRIKEINSRRLFVSFETSFKFLGFRMPKRRTRDTKYEYLDNNQVKIIDTCVYGEWIKNKHVNNNLLTSFENDLQKNEIASKYRENQDLIEKNIYSMLHDNLGGWSNAI